MRVRVEELGSNRILLAVPDDGIDDSNGPFMGGPGAEHLSLHQKGSVGRFNKLFTLPFCASGDRAKSGRAGFGY
jgi:hypothetical protein